MSRTPSPPHDPDETAPLPAPSGPGDDQADSLADDRDPAREEQGRIGYGRLGRWSPVGLAVLILLTLGTIFLLDRGDGADEPAWSATTGELPEPRPAPAFELTLMNGASNGSDNGTDPLTLEDLKGKTVVLNFWASWCWPCREEMPILQAMSESSGDDVVFVGVGAKNDDQADAEAFAVEFGVTYPIGRDTEGGDSRRGQIERDYGVPGYPATFFITPDGMINQIVFAEISAETLDTAIANASD